MATKSYKMKLIIDGDQYTSMPTHHVLLQLNRTTAENVLRLRWRKSSHLDFLIGQAATRYRADRSLIEPQGHRPMRGCMSKRDGASVG